MIGGIGFDSYGDYNTSDYIASAKKAVLKNEIRTEDQAKDAGLSDAEIRRLKKSGQIECQTCSTRRYQDASDEQVSFKTASHISPNEAGARVRAHENEHVANAYKKAAMGDGKVMQASVSIHMSVCPECGRSFVSGGVTHTSILYKKPMMPYGANGKSKMQGLLGANFAATV